MAGAAGLAGCCARPGMVAQPHPQASSGCRTGPWRASDGSGGASLRAATIPVELAGAHGSSGSERRRRSGFSIGRPDRAKWRRPWKASCSPRPAAAAKATGMMAARSTGIVTARGSGAGDRLDDVVRPSGRGPPDDAIAAAVGPHGAIAEGYRHRAVGSAAGRSSPRNRGAASPGSGRTGAPRPARRGRLGRRREGERRTAWSRGWLPVRPEGGGPP